MILAFAREGLLFSPALTSSPKDTCSAGVRSIKFPSCGVAVPEPGADGGREGVGAPFGVTRDVSSKNVLRSAKDALSSGGACVGAVNNGTRDDTSGARIDRAALASGAGADIVLIVSTGAALASCAVVLIVVSGATALVSCTTALA